MQPLEAAAVSQGRAVYAVWKTNELKSAHILMKTWVWLILCPKFNFGIIKWAGCKPWRHLERLNAQNMPNPRSQFFVCISLCLCLLELSHTGCCSTFNNGIKEENANLLLPNETQHKGPCDFWCPPSWHRSRLEYRGSVKTYLVH